MLFFNAQLSAMPIDIAEKDSLHSVENVDTVSNVTPVNRLPNVFLGTLGKFVRNFSEVDTNYIEPQSYNYTLMLQNTNTYELYRITSENGNYFHILTSAFNKARPIFRLAMGIPRLYIRLEAYQQRKQEKRVRPVNLQFTNRNRPILPKNRYGL